MAFDPARRSAPSSATCSATISRRCSGNGGSMKATQRLREAGQSLWLDHITRALLASGTLAKRTYKGYRDLLASDRYVKSLAAPHSVDTMPEKTLLALADHGEIGPMLPHDGGSAQETLHRFT